MKVMLISDTHNKHWEISEKFISNVDGAIDAIIHAGDISGRGTKSEVVEFLEWYTELPFKYKIFIAGNHDFFFEQSDQSLIKKVLDNYPNIIYLNDSGVEIEGVKIWGSPVQPWFYNWAFNRVGADIKRHWDLIPQDTRVLVTHGPVRGYLDRTKRGELVGCPFLLENIGKLPELKLHVAGHIHEAYGQYTLANGQIFVNASVLNLNYIMTNDPIVIDLKIK